MRFPATDHIAIWNNGNKTIDFTEVAIRDPLKLTYTGATILEVNNLRGTRPAINASASDQSEAEIRLSFDFLDPGDGIALSVM